MQGPGRGEPGEGARRSPRQSGMKGCETPRGGEIRLLPLLLLPFSSSSSSSSSHLSKAKDGHVLRTKPRHCRVINSSVLPTAATQSPLEVVRCKRLSARLQDHGLLRRERRTTFTRRVFLCKPSRTYVQTPMRVCSRTEGRCHRFVFTAILL